METVTKLWIWESFGWRDEAFVSALFYPGRIETTLASSSLSEEVALSLIEVYYRCRVIESSLVYKSLLSRASSLILEISNTLS